MMPPRARAARLVLPVLMISPLFGACGADAGTSDAATSGGAVVDGRAGGSLGEPTAAFPEDFGTIQTVRELPDRRVLVADPLANALWVVDLDAGTRTQIGTEGEGPGEYRQPDAVWPLPGGETLLVDLGNGRTQTLTADLEFSATSPIAMGEPRPGSTLVLALPQGVDGQGRLYTRAMGGGMGGPLPDSAAILRVDRATAAVDTVGSFKLQDRIQSTSGDANSRSVSIEPIPLSPEDAWGVASDGSVVIARSGDYRVDWLEPDGSVVRGQPAPFDPVPIGTAEKEEYVATQGRSGGGIGISVMVGNGAMRMNFARGGPGARAREIDQYQWPETKPPFYSGRIDVDPEGRAWVRRHVAAGEEATYDVFARDGARVATVRLPADRRVIGFGASAVYVVAYDELDLNYLERYALPEA